MGGVYYLPNNGYHSPTHTVDLPLYVNELRSFIKQRRFPSEQAKVTMGQHNPERGISIQHATSTSFQEH